MESVRIGIGIEWDWLGLESELVQNRPELAGIDPRYIQTYDYFLLNEKYF